MHGFYLNILTEVWNQLLVAEREPQEPQGQQAQQEAQQALQEPQGQQARKEIHEQRVRQEALE
jgi:hypothetical protein